MFETNKDFLEVFEISSEDNGFYDPILLRDARYGFSVKRKYPDDISFKSPILKSGEPDEVAVIWVVLRVDDKKDDGRIPVHLRISKFSLWKSEPGNFDYDFENENSPTKESVEISRETRAPIELEENDYFYCEKTSRFVDKKGKEVDPSDILEGLFRDHCLTVDKYQGLELRFKKLMRDVVVCKLLDAMRAAIKFLLEKVFDKELIAESMSAELWSGYKEAKAKNIHRSIKIFDYEASRSTVVLFCGGAVLLNLLDIWGNEEFSYLMGVSSSNFLILVHSILMLIVIEAFPTWVLLPVLNVVIRMKRKFSYIKINPYTHRVWFPYFFMVGILAFVFGAAYFVSVALY